MFCKCLRSVSIWPSANLPGDPTRGISSSYFASTFLDEVVASGLGPHEPVYTVEKVIRRKGEAVICPRDGRLGAAYVDVVTGDPILPDHGPGAGKSEFMLSYSWGYGVGTIADTLTDFFGRDVHRYVWICCLCINQHRVKEAQAAGEVVPFKEFEEAFGKRVAGVSHILAMMSPWQEPLYLKRVWCVFEFSRAMAEKKELTVLMPAEEREAFRSHLFGSGLRELFAGLAALRIQEAKASVPVDKENILRTIDPDSKEKPRRDIT
ncbi:Hypothetical protein (Fragment) [Durusdinium trenchii]|uniref:Uncharacterized protein n=1 Tax=Durusdinium trenchii TaxID=1381693 RepID=A0ABP0RNT7_9DINO